MNKSKKIIHFLHPDATYVLNTATFMLGSNITSSVSLH